MISALSLPSAIRSFPTATGNLKRRGPALPGLTKSTPSRSMMDGLCEWPLITVAMRLEAQNNS
jgi:hypothetical protein